MRVLERFVILGPQLVRILSSSPSTFSCSGHPTKDVHPEPAEGLFSHSELSATGCRPAALCVLLTPLAASLTQKQGGTGCWSYQFLGSKSGPGPSDGLRAGKPCPYKGDRGISYESPPTLFCYITRAAASNYAHPATGRFLMQTASIQWIGEQKFLAVSPSGHAVPFDSDRESNKAPGAMEMTLMALGACTATDMVLILEKKRQKLESLEVLCSGERAPEPPTVWTKLEVLFRLRGTLDEAAVQHAMSLTEEKYCSVAAMLKKTAAFTWRYEILPPAAAK